MQNIKQIETIIVLMFENRSFDHLMGYLSLPPYNRPVEGLLQAAGFTCDYNGFEYPLFRLGNPDQKLRDDPPHERPDIGTQLDPDGDYSYSMKGFVRSYAQLHGVDPGDQPMVVGYYTAEDVPATHFFASNYGICDHWFAAIPTGTQPNRLMAMSGYTLNDVNQSAILPKQDLIYDWLTRNGISWRVYHMGIPFFMMMDDWHVKVLTDDHFRSYDEFQNDLVSQDPFPQVVFIEPRYTDAPHFEAPCDDHPPSPVTAGQNFLKLVYSDLMTNWERWLKTLMIVNYDENGGFFDHVKPLSIPTTPGAGASFKYGPFRTTGPRVPAYLISPFVKPGSVYKGNLDHTSVLKCIAKRFGNGSYSPEVDSRPVGDIWDALELDAPRGDDADFPPPPNVVGFTPNSTPTEPIPLAFNDAAAKAKTEAPAQALQKFPELFSHFEEIGPASTEQPGQSVT
ncbi:MAG TPA: alkaline phosphatase family protein [Verrucomicrobiae bacterium]|nr:alkaline phosphatase family protein [Verrucomicrobiae bacterium]